MYHIEEEGKDKYDGNDYTPDGRQCMSRCCPRQTGRTWNINCYFSIFAQKRDVDESLRVTAAAVNRFRERSCEKTQLVRKLC